MANVRSTNTIVHGGKYTLSQSRKYGDFKYGSGTKYGATTYTTVAQAMPKMVDTREI